MPRLLGIDLETTGFDFEKNRIIEVGVSLHESGSSTPIVSWGKYCYDDKIGPLSSEIKNITEIRDEDLREFGEHPSSVFSYLDAFCGDHHIDYLVAHNGANFDQPFLLAELDKFSLGCTKLRSIPWLDTRRDIPFKNEPVSRKLNHLLADLHRAHNLIPHRAMFDAAATMWLLAQYDFDQVIEYWKQPWKVIRAQVPKPWDDAGKGKDAAKACGFRWEEVNHKKYSGCWVKLVKENEIESERKKLPEYPILIIE